ncbi:hypothetical protein ACJMK2_043224 [Sinanodonta woodiana]|uniref:Uncharacterized protein n=1 Tax=Sinanodonta woodiana TaxID=1069815 RepID=A0ABD3VX16_SINWO
MYYMTMSVLLVIPDFDFVKELFVKHSDVCPRFKCPGIEPPECAQPTYFFYKGHLCRGCDRNICKND